MQIFEFLILAAAIRLVKDIYGKIQKKKNTISPENRWNEFYI